MFRRVLVGDNERVLFIRKKRFIGILGPGEYWIFTPGQHVELERHNTKFDDLFERVGRLPGEGAPGADVAVRHRG